MPLLIIVFLHGVVKRYFFMDQRLKKGSILTAFAL